MNFRNDEIRGLADDEHTVDVCVQMHGSRAGVTGLEWFSNVSPVTSLAGPDWFVFREWSRPEDALDPQHRYVQLCRVVQIIQRRRRTSEVRP